MAGDPFRLRLARWIAGKPAARAVGLFSPAKVGQRMYAGARPARTSGWGSTSSTSADAELITSLTNLRNRSRCLVRDAAYAKRAKVVVVNNVVGSGMGMQAQVMTSRDALNERVNDDIESAWEQWAEAKSCHTGGSLHFSDLERAAMGQVFEAGEVIIRKHQRAFGDSRIPYALELVEAERLADIARSQRMGALVGNTLRMGIELDSYYRPVAYWLHRRHPGDALMGDPAPDDIERVPADQIIHLRIVDRWPQTRGEPWLHAVVRKLNDMDGYSESELIAARLGANYFATIESAQEDPLGGEIEDDTGQKEINLEPGVIEQLLPGEELKFHTPNRPNTALDPFMRYMLREVAAGTGVSYESLSRDYSQSNYSSSRLALLDDRDLWRMLQSWFIRSFRCEVHREWLQAAVYSRSIMSIPVEQYVADPRKFEAVRFKPRGWSWIDPQKEVEARKAAVRAGFDTMTNVIAETANGRDIEDIMRERARELDMAETFGLNFDTDVMEPAPPATPAAQPSPLPADQSAEDAQARVLRFGASK